MILIKQKNKKNIILHFILEMNQNPMLNYSNTAGGVEPDDISTNIDQTVLNLVGNPNNIINILGESINQHQHHSPLLQESDSVPHESTAALNSEVGEQNQQQTDEHGQQPSGLVAAVLKTLQSSLPFAVILIAKIFHQHLLGFLIAIGFMATLHWSNRTLVNQVQLKVVLINKALIDSSLAMYI